MAALLKVSESEKSLARKAGKLPKAPKKPKRNASLTVLDNYITRHNDYVKKIKDRAAKSRRKEAVLKQIFG